MGLEGAAFQFLLAAALSAGFTGKETLALLPVLCVEGPLHLFRGCGRPEGGLRLLCCCVVEDTWGSSCCWVHIIKPSISEELQVYCKKAFGDILITVFQIILEHSTKKDPFAPSVLWFYFFL